MTSEYGYESDYIQGSDKYIEESRTIPQSSKKKRSKAKESIPEEPEPQQEPSPRKSGSQQCPENRSCLAKLLASNCWLSYLCWTLCCPKPRCPAYRSCPCGAQGPCAKMKPCPANQAKKSIGRNGTLSCSPCSALCGKIFGKKHEHTDCCCRCDDNPPLNGKPRKKSSVKPSIRLEEPGEPDEPSQESHDYGSDQYLDNKSDVQPVLIYAKKSHYDMMKQSKSKRVTRKKKVGTKRGRRLREPRKKKLTADVLSNSSQGITPKKSPPDSESTEMCHRISKTLSTDHGPVRVDQKIEFKGTKDSFVVVSHGKACECDLCSALKNSSMSLGKLGTVNNVGRSKDREQIQMNHMEDCSCSLCTALENDLMSKKRQYDDIEDLLMAYSSKAYSGKNEFHQGSVDSNSIINTESTNETDSKEGIPQNLFSNKHRLNADHSKNFRRGGSKKKACYCTQCSQMKNIRELKRKLDRELGFAEFYQLLQNLSQPSTFTSSTGVFPSNSTIGQTTHNGWGEEKNAEISGIPVRKVKKCDVESTTEPPTNDANHDLNWQLGNKKFAADSIFMAHPDGSDEARPKIIHWLQSSSDIANALGSKLSIYIPDPDSKDAK